MRCEMEMDDISMERHPPSLVQGMEGGVRDSMVMARGAAGGSQPQSRWIIPTAAVSYNTCLERTCNKRASCFRQRGPVRSSRVAWE